MNKTLLERWRQPLRTVHVRNAPVVANLRAALKEGCAVVELVGGPGTGKTTLVNSLQFETPSLFDGAVECFIGSSAFPFMHSVNAVAEGFKRSRGHNLLVVDQADFMEKADLLAGMERLSTGPWRFSTILTTRTPLDIGRAVYVTPLTIEDTRQLFEAELGQHLSGETIAKLWAASQGLPELATLLADEWRAGRVRSVDTLAELLNPLAAPGLVDLRGQPLSTDSYERKTIISDVRFVSAALLKAVANEPDLVHTLTPRQFEELSAELFQRQGYEVTITPQTRDGGKDLYLAKADDLGSFLYIVECKRYAPDRPVEVGVVRSLYGVAQHERVTAAMTLTTSYFSKDASDFAAEVRYQLTLKDFIGLKRLLSAYRQD